MKKSTLFILFAGLISGTIAAQPTLTATGISPLVNDVMTIHTSSYGNPGSAGANQTWNPGLSSTGFSSVTGTNPAFGPYAAAFTQATVGFNSSGSWSYYKCSSSAWQNAGVVSSSGTVMSYSDMEDMLRFPCNYNDSYTDTWSVTYVQASYTYYRVGTTTVTADGYGTLTSPAGTFSNVMRVHFYQDYQDSVNIMGNPIVITYTNDEYMWYLNGNHYPIAAVYTLTPSTGGPVQGALYLSGVVSDVNENSVLNSFSLAPNPANDQANLLINLDTEKEITVTIYNAIGQAIGTPLSVFGTRGENRISTPVTEFPEGIYFATISIDGEATSSNRFVVTH